MDQVELTAADIAANVDALLPEVRARAGEIAALRRLPLDLVETLKRAGVFRMPIPRAWGGPEMSLRQQIEVIETLSTADPSVGWCVMIGSDAGFYSAWLDDDVARRLWPDIDMVTAGWVFPAGRARECDGGYVVDGHWSFGSGCTHADVIIGGCLVVDDAGSPKMNGNGQPTLRIVVAPAASFEIVDTWHTTGLAGSGSNDYRCAQLFVPAEHTFWLEEPPRRSGALYAFRGAFFANMQGVGLGLARRALDEVIAIASTKVLLPQMIAMRDVARVREAVAEAETLLRSTRAYVYAAVDAATERLERGEELTLDERLDIALSRVQAFRTAKQVALAMVQVAGTQAIYSSSILDRLLRDAITINQHVASSAVTVEAAGALALGTRAESGLAVLL